MYSGLLGEGPVFQIPRQRPLAFKSPIACIEDAIVWCPLSTLGLLFPFTIYDLSVFSMTLAAATATANLMEQTEKNIQFPRARPQLQ